jgi:hypothetical protein
MRERAEAALAYEDSEGWWRPDPLRQAFDALAGEDEAIPGSHQDAEHMAAWRPAVAVAVAAWLDACALVTEVAPDRHKGNALAVARAYLGEDPR